MIVHTSTGGHRLRVRLSNTFGAVPLAIDHPVSFNGRAAVSIPPGAHR